MAYRIKHNRIPQSKVAIIGAGAVGATIAYTLMAKTMAAEVILIDINKKKLEGEIMDLDDGQCFSETGTIIAGDYRDAADADIIILTAGLAQKVGETRLQLIEKNREIAKTIFKEIGEIKPSAIVIVVTNPVDVMANIVQGLVNLPHGQVFGTGTALDTARLRSELAHCFGVYAHDVNGYILGEHGDSEFAAWSTVSVGGIPLKDLKITNEKMDEIEKTVRSAAYEIINRKGATFYGIAMATVDIVGAILFDQHKILPLSHRLNNWNCVSGLCVGSPAVVGRNGIEKSWPLELSSADAKKFKKSAEVIKKYL